MNKRTNFRQKILSSEVLANRLIGSGRDREAASGSLIVSAGTPCRMPRILSMVIGTSLTRTPGRVKSRGRGLARRTYDADLTTPFTPNGFE